MNPVKIKSYHPINTNYDGFNDDDDGDGDSDDNSNNHNNKQDSLTSKYTKRIRKNRFSPFFSPKYHHLIYLASIALYVTNSSSSHLMCMGEETREPFMCYVESDKKKYQKIHR